MVEPLLTTADVAAIYQVEPETVADWVRAGKIRAVRTPGGRALRFLRSEVEPTFSPANVELPALVEPSGEPAECMPVAPSPLTESGLSVREHLTGP